MIVDVADTKPLTTINNAVQTHFMIVDVADTKPLTTINNVR